MKHERNCMLEVCRNLWDLLEIKLVLLLEPYKLP